MAGNANSGRKQDKLIRDALLLAANRVSAGDPAKRKLLAIAAEKVVQAAAEGDLAAFKELADRIDGKPVAQVDMNVTESPAEKGDDALLSRVRELIAQRSGRGGMAEAAGNKVKPH